MGKSVRITKIFKFVLRKLILPFTFQFKIDQIVLYFAKPSYKSVLYHGVIPFNGNFFSPRHITIEQFEQHIIYFKKNFEIIRQSDLFERVKKGIKASKPTIALSFDDGFKNNLDYALPILEKHNVPCTFFISSSLVKEMDIRCLWPELIELLFYENEKTVEINGLKFKNKLNEKNGVLITDYIKKLEYSERKKVIAEIIIKYDLKNKIQSIPEELWKLMSKEELKKLARSNLVDIGDHSFQHYNLGLIDKENIYFELSHSKKLLEGVLNREINMLAFPDGSYSSDAKNIAEEIGYKQQYVLNYRLPNDFSDSRILNRYCISSTTTFESNILRLCLSFLKRS